MIHFPLVCCYSVTQSCPTLRPRGLQHTRLPWPSLSPGVCSNSCPLSQQCHPTISSSVVPFFCPQSFPASWSFPMSRPFASGGQKYLSFSFSISPSNECSGLISFRMDWTDLLAVQGTLKSLFQHLSLRASVPQCSAFCAPLLFRFHPPPGAQLHVRASGWLPWLSSVRPVTISAALRGDRLTICPPVLGSEASAPNSRLPRASECDHIWK